MEFLIDYFKKTYKFGNNIVTALQKLLPINLQIYEPNMKSTDTDPDVKATESKQFKIEFKVNYDLFSKCKETYQNNETKAYALLWEHSTKGMKSKVEA